MRHKHLFLNLALAAGICGVLLSAPAQAQPDDNNAPKGQNPPNWNWNPGGQAGNRGVLGGRPLRLPLTPEQLRLLHEQRAEAKALTIKQRLTGAGFTDGALQTAIVAEFKTQDATQSDLMDKWQKINQALLVNQTPTADIAALLKDFREAVAKEKARRLAAVTALEAQFQISQKPVLDALLMTMGITGDEAGFVAQTAGGGLRTILTLPAIGAVAGGDTVVEGGVRIVPLPQGGIANGPIFDGPAVNNGRAGNAMPNAAPAVNDHVFF